jgi:hypothetical protein
LQLFATMLSRSNMAAMISPIIDIEIATTALAKPISRPRTLAVRIIAMRLLAGPEKRKAVASLIPAPL